MAREDTVIRFGVVDQLSPALARIDQGFGALSRSVAGFVGGAAAIGATFTTIGSAIQRFDRLGDLSRSLNISTRSLSELGFAAEQSGSSSEKLQQALARLNKEIGDAAGGNAAAIEKFRKLGVSVEDASGNARAADDVFVEVAEAIKGLGTGAEQASATASLFGRGMSELIPLFNEGRVGLAALTAEARAFGASIGEDAVANAQTYRDNVDKLNVAWQSFANGLTNEILPSLVALSEAGADSAREVGGLGSVGETVGKGFSNLAIGLVALDAGFESIGAAASAASTALRDGPNEALDQLITKLDAIRGRSEDSIGRLADGVFKLDTSLAKAGASIQGTERFTIRLGGKLQTLTPDIVRTAEAAEEAAKRQAELSKAQAASEATARRLEKAQEDLADALNAAFRDGLKPTTEKMQEFSALTGRLVRTDLPDIQVEIKRTSDTWQGLGNVVTEEAQFFQDNWLGATEAVNDAFADFVAGNIRSFEDFGDALESIARQFLANLVRQFLNTNLQLPIPSFGGGGGGLGGLFGGGGAGAGAAAGGPLAFLTNFANNPIAAAAAVYAGGSAIARALGGRGDIGGIFGGLVGALFQQDPPGLSVIGDDLVGTRGFRNLAPGSNFESRLGGFNFGSINGIDRSTRDAIGTAVVDFDNEIASLLNDDQLAAVTDALAGFNLRLEEGAVTAENILGSRFDAILSTFDEDTQAFVRNAGDLQEQVQALAEILERPARLNALLQSLEDADRLAGISPFGQALERITDDFDAAAAAAEELGASQEQLARIEELRGNAIERLEQAQRTSLDSLLRDLRLDELPAAERAIVEINERFDELRTQAIALGATQEDLDRIERGRTRALAEQADATRDATNALEGFYDAIAESGRVAREFEADFLGSLSDAIGSVRDFLNGGASVSSLNPLQRLQQSQGQFAEIVRQISIGNVDAIRGFSGGANAFLQQAAAFYGVGSAEFQSIERAVLGTAQGIVGTNTGGSMAEALASLRPLFQRMIDLLANQGTLTAQQTQQVTEALRRLGGTPARAV